MEQMAEIVQAGLDSWVAGIAGIDWIDWIDWIESLEHAQNRSRFVLMP